MHIEIPMLIANQPATPYKTQALYALYGGFISCTDSAPAILAYFHLCTITYLYEFMGYNACTGVLAGQV